MIELSMHILDIVENSVTAGASEVSIRIEENRKKDVLIIEIMDNGKGMDETMQRMVVDPFVTTKDGKRVGLGLAMFSEAARRGSGEVSIDSKPDRGTMIRARFGLSHIDRQPLGDMIETMVTLIVGYPDVNFTYQHIRNGKGFQWNTEKIREQLGDLPRSSPEVVDFVQGEMEKLERFEVYV